MPKITKRVVDATETRAQDYFIWDDERPGSEFVFFRRARGITSSSTGSYSAIHNRPPMEGSRGGPQGRPNTSRQDRAGRNPSEQRKLDLDAMTVRELCECYLGDAEKGLILGKGRRPKKQSSRPSTEAGSSVISLSSTRRLSWLWIPSLPTFRPCWTMLHSRGGPTLSIEIREGRRSPGSLAKRRSNSINTANVIIPGVEASRAIRQAEVGTSRTMLNRTAERARRSRCYSPTSSASLRLGCLRLRGHNGARNEFLLAATAQNLRKLAKLRPMTSFA